MKKGFVLGVSLLLAFSSFSATAEILTVNVRAQVVEVNDPDNILGGQVSVGQAASGSYRYETTVPDQFSDPEYGQYLQNPQQGRTSIVVGPFTFESDPASSNWQYEVRTSDSYYQDYFWVTSGANKPLANGAGVSMLNIEFSNYSGTSNSGGLLTSAPNLVDFPHHAILISGYSPYGSWYTLSLWIDAVEVAPALQVSPASSALVRSQRIDPAVLSTNSNPLSNLRGNINGAPLPASYLDQCQVTPPNSQNRAGLSCPDIVPLLTGGANHVEWSVDLSDGSTVGAAVDWEMIE